MRRRLLRAVPAVLVLVPLLALAAAPRKKTRHAAKPASASADLVLRHGAVYTVDAARRWAEAVAVANGRIVFVGRDADAERWIGPKTRIVDLAGKMLLPGFHDSHVHPIDGGIDSLEVDLHGLATPAEVLARVHDYAVAHPDAPWVRGSGWELPTFPNANPTKDLLDKIVPDRPVFLWAMDGHSAWVNSKALAIAGVTKDTPDPPHGRIERDASGDPSGALREDASDLVASHLPKRTPKDHADGLTAALRIANGFGLTSLQEARASEADLAAYAAADASGRLTARIVASIHCDTGKGAADVPRMVALRRKYHGRRLRADGVKIFADGVLETRTAAVLDPYVGFPGDRGKLNVEPDAFKALAVALDAEGFQIHVHAIGDRAIRVTLDALEAARETNGARDSRHHIAHLELIDPADIPRFRTLGVVANFQPFWASGDEYLLKLTEPELGPARSRWLYPIRSVRDAGAEVAFGSDWDVSSLNPLDGIEVAVTHREPSKGPGSGPPWLAEETIGLPEAIAAYTIGGAYLDFTERETGSIETGKAADLIVLDKNLFAIPPSRIHETKVLWTLLEGREVFKAPGFSPAPSP
ncbi:MAG TPA: amidohydrolase [Thermoanaerobaculia bacterium]